MFTDLTEEAMLNGIPLGGSGGIVADGDRHTEAIDQLLLKGMFPSSDPGSVTPTAVGQDEQLGSIGIVPSPGVAPPPGDVVSSKLRGVMRDSHKERAAVAG